MCAVICYVLEQAQWEGDGAAELRTLLKSNFLKNTYFLYKMILNIYVIYPSAETISDID